MPEPKAKLAELKARLAEINDLNNAAAMLGWDQLTYMPSGGAPARGRQLATLGRLAHEMLIQPGIGRLLDDLRPYEQSLPYEDDDASSGNVPSNPIPIAIDGKLNRYLTAGDVDWFTLTLP